MSWQERRCNAEGFGRPEPFFFLCEERTYSPPGCMPGGGTAASHQSCALRGGLRSLRSAPDNTAEPAGVGRHCLYGWQIGLRPVCSFTANCCPLSGQPATRLRKPATAQGTPFGCGSFVAVMDDATPHRPFSFVSVKETKPPLVG